MEPEKTSECKWFGDRIDDYLDQSVAPVWSARFESHREVCAACRAELLSAERTLDLLRSLPREECPQRVVEAIYSATHAESLNSPLPTPARTDFWREFILGGRPVAISLAALFLVLLATISWNDRLKEEVGPEGFSRTEIERAERQVTATLAYVGQISLQGIAAAGRATMEEAVAAPVEKTLATVLRSDAFRLDRGKAGEKTK